ncbi:hypothetical protein [Aestuariivirga sp.]|uniref:hypothetical protein n=1 Tax=Aestuariivirga sp. TaxID=2650926 RepID=UPI003BA86A85
MTGGATLDTHAYIHYLHHKFFEVNNGWDGLIPLDKWFGNWHCGAREGQQSMEDRLAKNVACVNAAVKSRR